MREGWVTASLGEACVIQSGAGFPKNLQGEPNGELPFYKVSDMNTPGNERFMSGSSNYITETVRKDLGAKIFPKGAIVFPKVGGAILTNKKRQITTDSCVDNNIMGLVPKKRLILSDFLRYFMESFDIYDLSNRANPPSIRQSTVANWPILLPPLPEQKRIVAILDEAFAGIASAVANTENNLANARELFESHLNSVFSQRDPGDATRQRWLRVKLQEACERVTVGHVGKTSAYYSGEGVLFLRTQNVGKNALDLNDVKFVTPEFHKSLKKSQLVAGDVLISRVVTEEMRCAIVPPDLGAANCANIILLRPGEGLDSYFLHYSVQSPGAQRYLLDRRVGSAQQVVNTRVLKDWEISVPPLPEQKRIVAILDELSGEIRRLQNIYLQKLHALTELKQCLLQKAFSGELTAAPQDEIETALA